MKEEICRHLYWIEIISKILSHNFILMICGGFGGLYGWWRKERYFYYKEIERDFLKAKADCADYSIPTFDICDQYFRLLNCQKKYIRFVESAIYHYLGMINKSDNSTVKNNFIEGDLNWYLETLRKFKKKECYNILIKKALEDCNVDKDELIGLGAQF